MGRSRSRRSDSCASALAGRRPPSGPIVDLAFPLRDGTYAVANGGSNELVSAHIQTLVPSASATFVVRATGWTSCSQRAWTACLWSRSRAIPDRKSSSGRRFTPLAAARCSASRTGLLTCRRQKSTGSIWLAISPFYTARACRCLSVACGEAAYVSNQETASQRGT